ncbi:MAG TPA: hypothetical protein VG674_16660 [Amycolatopsis sp.]|nr:hypothetical protein [Amycolatopsis sp.]
MGESTSVPAHRQVLADVCDQADGFLGRAVLTLDDVQSYAAGCGEGYGARVKGVADEVAAVSKKLDALITELRGR